ncbi:MAG: hypothetical protein U0457_04280 [Candidatus Sericytochromatia bacterium]
MLLEVVKEKHEKIKLEGKIEREVEMSINMIKEGFENKIISKITGLTIEKIETLRKNIS